MTEVELTITVNGETRAVAMGATVADLLLLLGLAKGAVAVERNRELVRRAEHAATVVEDGDSFEIVTFFGGG